MHINPKEANWKRKMETVECSKLSNYFSMEKVMQKVNALGLAADELSLSDPCGMDALSEM